MGKLGDESCKPAFAKYPQVRDQLRRLVACECVCGPLGPLGLVEQLHGEGTMSDRSPSP